MLKACLQSILKLKMETECPHPDFERSQWVVVTKGRLQRSMQKAMTTLGCHRRPGIFLNDCGGVRPSVVAGA